MQHNTLLSAVYLFLFFVVVVVVLRVDSETVWFVVCVRSHALYWCDATECE